MIGYWRRPEEDALVFRGDWFASGDLASFDADGYVWFHGRADDLMNPGGFRVSPLEVEAALADHPAVAEVAVAEHEVREGVVVIAAFVVPKASAHAGIGPALAQSILDRGAERLAVYKRPREVFFVDALPRSANGKVLRRALRAHVGAPALALRGGSGE
jgi:acyl-coenzyme A synthetase/AMP-(fatty) acid ligase